MKWHRAFLRIDTDEPVYHDLAPYADGAGRRTVCGRPVAPYKPLIPTKHARKFGHPCRDCFPGGDS